MLLSRYFIIFIVSVFLCSQQAFAMGSMMNNSSTEETQKPFSFEDYEVDNENIEPMKQDLLKRFPIGSDYAVLKKALLEAGANVKPLHPDIIKESHYHPNSQGFSKKYYKIFWRNINWIIFVNTDGKNIKDYKIYTFGLTLK